MFELRIYPIKLYTYMGSTEMYLFDIKLNFMPMRFTFIQHLSFILQDGYWFVYLLMLG